MYVQNDLGQHAPWCSLDRKAFDLRVAEHYLRTELKLRFVGSIHGSVRRYGDISEVVVDHPAGGISLLILPIRGNGRPYVIVHQTGPVPSYFQVEYRYTCSANRTVLLSFRARRFTGGRSPTHIAALRRPGSRARP
jgi:hypothetical protein